MICADGCIKLMGEERNVEQAVAKTKCHCGDLAQKTADKANAEGRCESGCAVCRGDFTRVRSPND